MRRHAQQNAMNPAAPSPVLPFGEFSPPEGTEVGGEGETRKRKTLRGSAEFAKYSRIFSCALLSLVFLAWPSLLLPESSPLKFAPGVEDQIRKHLKDQGLTGQAINKSIKDIQNGLVALDEFGFLDQKTSQSPKLSEIASSSTSGISHDRSTLGPLRGPWFPSLGALIPAVRQQG
jgi:hypothetical protein